MDPEDYEMCYECPDCEKKKDRMEYCLDKLIELRDILYGHAEYDECKIESCLEEAFNYLDYNFTEKTKLKIQKREE
jgi:hypothetical protein